MNTLLTKQQTNSKRIYGKQPGKPIVVPEHGIIIHKNHYSSQRGASTPRGIHMDLKAEMQVQDEEPKDLTKVNAIGKINQGFDGQVKNTDEETLDLN